MVVFDLLGKPVVVVEEYYPESVLLFSLPSGMYFVRVETADGMETKKLLVK